MTSLRLKNVYITYKILEENLFLYSITNFSFLKELLSHSLVAGIRKKCEDTEMNKNDDCPIESNLPCYLCLSLTKSHFKTLKVVEY